MSNIKFEDLEFEGGMLCKVRGFRYNYMDGNQLLSLIRNLGQLLYKRRLAAPLEWTSDYPNKWAAPTPWGEYTMRYIPDTHTSVQEWYYLYCTGETFIDRYPSRSEAMLAAQKHHQERIDAACE